MAENALSSKVFPYFGKKNSHSSSPSLKILIVLLTFLADVCHEVNYVILKVFCE